MTTISKRKITLMIDSEVYIALREKVGGRGIGTFLSNLARPYVVKSTLDAGYKSMALDQKSEARAKEWIESDLDLADSENVWQF